MILSDFYLANDDAVPYVCFAESLTLHAHAIYLSEVCTLTRIVPRYEAIASLSTSTLAPRKPYRLLTISGRFFPRAIHW